MFCYLTTEKVEKPARIVPSFILEKYFLSTLYLLYKTEFEKTWNQFLR